MGASLRKGDGAKAGTWAAKSKDSLSVNNKIRNAKDGTGGFGSLARVGLHDEELGEGAVFGRGQTT